MRLLSIAMRLVMGLLLAASLTACATKAGLRTVQVVATPVTVVRDIVDVPVFTITNCFEYFARQSHLAKAPGANVGWSWKGGFNFGLGYDVSWLLFKSLSGVFGAVDYLVCRSIYPNFPYGVSPWTKAGDGWGKYYFPGTKALWNETTGDEVEVVEPPVEAPPQPQGKPQTKSY